MHPSHLLRYSYQWKRKGCCIVHCAFIENTLFITRQSSYIFSYRSFPWFNRLHRIHIHDLLILQRQHSITSVFRFFNPGGVEMANKYGYHQNSISPDLHSWRPRISDIPMESLFLKWIGRAQRVYYCSCPEVHSCIRNDGLMENISKIAIIWTFNKSLTSPPSHPQISCFLFELLLVYIIKDETADSDFFFIKIQEVQAQRQEYTAYHNEVVSFFSCAAISLPYSVSARKISVFLKAIFLHWTYLFWSG